jgi:hypothetical protein
MMNDVRVVLITHNIGLRHGICEKKERKTQKDIEFQE